MASYEAKFIWIYEPIVLIFFVVNLELQLQIEQLIGHFEIMSSLRTVNIRLKKPGIKKIERLIQLQVQGQEQVQRQGHR